MSSKMKLTSPWPIDINRIKSRYEGLEDLGYAVKDFNEYKTPDGQYCVEYTLVVPD